MHNNHSGQRAIVDNLEKEFAGLLASLPELIKSIPPDLIYKQPRADNAPAATVGENVLKCAAVVEQLFGGLTANLWDDPFEWTLPETLSTADLILDYSRKLTRQGNVHSSTLLMTKLFEVRDRSVRRTALSVEFAS